MRELARRLEGESDPDKVAFLTAAGRSLAGVSTWAGRHGEFLASEAGRCTDAGRASEAISDLHGAQDYKEHIVGVLLKRAFNSIVS